MILVIGAGVAGLAAASELASAGRDVVVLEARDRAGGRVHTARDRGAPVEIGALWIHGTEGNAVLDFARRRGLRTVEAAHDIYPVATHAPLSSADPRNEASRLQQISSEVVEEAGRRARRHATDRSLRDAVEDVRASAQCAEVDRATRWELSWLTLITGADVERLSAQSWDQDEDLPGPDHVLPEGYDRVPEQLAEGLDVRRGHHVERMTWSDHGVAAETADARFRGDAAIVTIPLGCLQAGDVVFDPPLPASKRHAINALGMGVLDKVILHFERRFWPPGVEHIGLLDAPDGCIVGWTALDTYGHENTLVGWVAGRLARELEAAPDAHVVDRAMASLQRGFARVPEPSAAHVTRWDADRYARGSYSHVAVGASGADYDRLAEPAGPRLLFAGEATYRTQPSTVHGAFMSGLREARRLLAGSR